jgi:aspartate carbamoyltransferase catalytic subunit
MKHLLRIHDLTEVELRRLVMDALSMKSWNTKRLEGKQIGLLFLEASTRTRASFEVAAHRLGAATLLIESRGSSFEKGETLLDTLLNLEAIGLDLVVLRCGSSDNIEEARQLKHMSVVNGGDGVREHPTQALLDLCALVAHPSNSSLEALEGKKLLILGDLAHSRVARSWAELAPRVGLDLIFCGPEAWRPKGWAVSVPFLSDKKAALNEADFVMALRVQKERLEAGGEKHWDSRFQLRAQDLDEDQLLLHPGPVNWGVELHPELQVFGQSQILRQVSMGVALRAAVLDLLLSKSL